MDIILLIVFCWQLHRLASEKGLNAWRWVLHFASGFIAIMFAFVTIMLLILGPEVLQTDEGKLKLLWIAPFTYMFEVFLFIYYRRRITRIVVPEESNDDYNRPEPPKQGKDFSYFR